jgi:hypothetical protein
MIGSKVDNMTSIPNIPVNFNEINYDLTRLLLFKNS